MAEGGIGYTESGTESDPLISSNPQNEFERMSVLAFYILTTLGYGEAIRWLRVKTYREIDALENAKPNIPGILITAGSKAEGLTGFYESDTDTLYVPHSVLCVEAGINLQTLPTDDMFGMSKDVFRMDTNTYPGYCKLLQERIAPISIEMIYDALCDNGDGYALSSDLFVESFANHIRQQPLQHMVQQERAGPSIPESSSSGLHRSDHVTALRCHCPSILQRWAVRPRHWPSPSIVQKVVSLGAYLTAVGFKGSENKNMEWRICFNTGETELVNNLNATQAKVYVMLKMILKDVLKPPNKEITSYVLKNIILWQAENNPQTRFHKRSLLYWLHDGLRELRTAILKKQLRYYMIPERNLMEACGLEDALQHKWVADITEMMTEGPMVIRRIEKIKKAVVKASDPVVQWFSEKRFKLEVLKLMWVTRVVQITDENGGRIIWIPGVSCYVNLSICMKKS